MLETYLKPDVEDFSVQRNPRVAGGPLAQPAGPLAQPGGFER